MSDERFSRINGALGLAARAGQVVAGYHPVLQAFAAGKAKLVVLSPHAGEATCRKFSRLAQQHGISAVQVPIEPGPAIGKPDCVVAAITHSGFAGNLQALLNTPQPTTAS